MSQLGAARAGTLAGAACTLGVGVWLVARAGRDVPTGLEGLLPSLWLVQALGVALLGPRCLGSGGVERSVGLLLLIGVPVPLLAVAWLSGTVGAATLAVGLSLLLALATGVTTLATVLGKVPWGRDVTALAAAVLEIGGAAGVWAFRDTWSSWVGL